MCQDHKKLLTVKFSIVHLLYNVEDQTCLLFHQSLCYHGIHQQTRPSASMRKERMEVWKRLLRLPMESLFEMRCEITYEILRNQDYHLKICKSVIRLSRFRFAEGQIF